MNIHIDRQRCEGNSVCVALAPDLFDLDDDGVAIVLNEDPGEEAIGGAERAANGFLREAIFLSG